jgi:PPP family 3-phenylpropionic acid transporter
VSDSHRVPYWRLSGFYFFYFAALGAFLPYWSLYLQAEGYTPAQIGQLMALLAATKLIAPNLWGWLADRFDRSVLLIRISSVLTAASFWLYGEFSGLGWMAFITGLAGMFWNAPLPLFEAVTLAYLRDAPQRYSRIRLWGSIGFIVTVLLLGKGLDYWIFIDCLPVFIFGLFAGMSLTTLTVPERSVRIHAGDGGSLWSLLKQPHVAAFLLVFMLIQVSHGPYYVFFSVYLKDHGYGGSVTGAIWSLGVFAEIGLFMYLHRLLQRFSLRLILLFSIALGVLRWWLIAWYVGSAGWIIFAQVLHAATFGSSHVAAIQLIRKYFAGPHHGKGQALYSSSSYGLGGMIGSYYSGALWGTAGPETVFSLAAAASLLAWIVVWLWVEKPVRQSL